MNVVDALKSKLESMAELKKVILGRRQQITGTDLPAVFIVPEAVNLPDYTLKPTILATARFTIFLIKEYRVQTLSDNELSDFFSLASSIIDTLMSDRSLDNTCKMLKLISIEPDFSEEAGVFYAFARIVIDCVFLV